MDTAHKPTLKCCNSQRLPCFRIQNAMPIKFPVFLLLIAALTSATPVSLNSGISTSDPKTRNTALRQKYADAIEAIFGIGIRSTALLADPSNTGNIIVSPVSITLLIGQLMLGAKGPFLDQLYNLLSLTKARYNENAWYIKGQDRVYPLPHARLHIHLKSLILELASRERNFTLHESNALFYDSDLQLDGNFQHYLKVFYDTLLQPLDFDHDPEGMYYSKCLFHVFLKLEMCRIIFDTSIVFASVFSFTIARNNDGSKSDKLYQILHKCLIRQESNNNKQ